MVGDTQLTRTGRREPNVAVESLRWEHLGCQRDSRGQPDRWQPRWRKMPRGAQYSRERRSSRVRFELHELRHRCSSCAERRPTYLNQSLMFWSSPVGADAGLLARGAVSRHRQRSAGV